MGVTGENLAEKYNITRQDCDEFALLSQKRWAEGNVELIRNNIYLKELTHMKTKLLLT